MPPEIEVRRVTALNSAVLIPLIQEHAVFERGMAEVSSAGLADALGSGTLIGWIAQSPLAPLGYATATVDFSTWRSRKFLHLDCLFVTTEYRNAGLGKLLLEEAKRHAIASGLEELQWQTPAWNEAACRFYDRVGAVGALKMRYVLRIPADAGERRPQHRPTSRASVRFSD